MVPRKTGLRLKKLFNLKNKECQEILKNATKAVNNDRLFLMQMRVWKYKIKG